MFGQIRVRITNGFRFGFYALKLASNILSTNFQKKPKFCARERGFNAAKKILAIKKEDRRQQTIPDDI